MAEKISLPITVTVLLISLPITVTVLALTLTLHFIHPAQEPLRPSYIHAYIRTYIHAKEPLPPDSYIHAYIRTYIHAKEPLPPDSASDKEARPTKSNTLTSNCAISMLELRYKSDFDQFI